MVSSGAVTIVNRSSDSIAEYRRQRATSASLQPCTLNVRMFSVRRNKATSRSIALNTLPLVYDKTPLTSKQDANMSPTISNQCITSSLYSETRLDLVRCSPKRGYLSPLCLRRDPLYSNTLPPCLRRNTIDLKTRQAEARPGEGIREMSGETERTSDSRLKVNNSHIVT